MMGIQTRRPAMLVAGGLAVSGLAPQPALTKDEESAQAAIAAIIGATTAVAAAKHGKDHNANTSWDDGRYGRPFEPVRGCHLRAAARTVLPAWPAVLPLDAPGLRLSGKEN